MDSHEGRVGLADPDPGRPDGRRRRTGSCAAPPIVMAEDVASLPATGITPVICGDAHLGNFGFYASPERDLVIDLNDFDEAHPGGWEWDLRRLVASIWVAGRAERRQRGAVRDGGARRAWRPTASEVAVPRRPAAAVAVVRPAGRRPPARDRHREDRCARRSRGPPSGPGTAPATGRCPGSPASTQGRRRIVEEPPLITRVPDGEAELIGGGPGRVPAHPGAALAPGAGRLHAGRHRAQGRRRRQRRAARLRRAAGGQQPGRRGVPAAQAGPPVGAGPATSTASRPGTPTRASGWWSTSRRCRRSATRCWAGPPSDGPAVLRAPVPQHEGHRRAGRASTPRRWPTTPASSGTCWPRATPGPAAPR